MIHHLHYILQKHDYLHDGVFIAKKRLAGTKVFFG